MFTRKILLRITLPILVCLTIFVIASKALVIARVHGQSMMPTFQEGDYILGLRIPCEDGVLKRLLKKLLIKREAVILLHPSISSRQVLVKRIVGISGQYYTWGAYNKPQVIPPNHVFVVGDASKNISTNEFINLPIDSRLYGPFPIEAIIARIYIKCWPIRGC